MPKLTLKQALERIAQFDTEKQEVLNYCILLQKDSAKAMELLIKTDKELEILKRKHKILQAELKTTH